MSMVPTAALWLRAVGDVPSPWPPSLGASVLQRQAGLLRTALQPHEAPRAVSANGLGTGRKGKARGVGSPAAASRCDTGQRLLFPLHPLKKKNRKVRVKSTFSCPLCLLIAVSSALGHLEAAPQDCGCALLAVG